MSATKTENTSSSDTTPRWHRQLEFAHIGEVMLIVDGLETIGDAVDVAYGFIGDEENMSFDVGFAETRDNGTHLVHFVSVDARAQDVVFPSLG